MSIFPNRSKLSDPTAVEVIPPEDFTYVITRSQLDMFNAVHAELDRHPVARNQLAKRIGMSESQLSRLLSAPGNWGLATAAKLFWAIAGGRMKITAEYPLQKPKRNDTRPSWADRELKVVEPSSNSSVASRPLSFAYEATKNAVIFERTAA